MRFRCSSRRSASLIPLEELLDALRRHSADRQPVERRAASLRRARQAIRDTLHDPHRDATTLPLIPHAVESGVPLLAICRGFQEMNVAFGGTLWQKVHEVAGLRRPSRKQGRPLDVQYGPAHEIELVPGGVLHRLAGPIASR